MEQIGQQRPVPEQGTNAVGVGGGQVVALAGERGQPGLIRRGSLEYGLDWRNCFEIAQTALVLGSFSQPGCLGESDAIAGRKGVIEVNRMRELQEAASGERTHAKLEKPVHLGSWLDAH